MKQCKHGLFTAVLSLLAGCTALPLEEVISPEVEVWSGEQKPGTLVVRVDDAEASLTRTTIQPSGEGYAMTWDGDESADLFERNNVIASLARYTSASVETASEGATAAFSYSGLAPVGGASAYRYDMLCPSSAVSGISGQVVSLTLPAAQSPRASSADPAASLLYARSESAYGKQPASLQLSFHHMVAYGHFTLKNLNLATGESLSSVAITAEDENLSGEITYDTSDGSIDYVADGESTLTLSAANMAVDAAGFSVWFACKPFTLEAGKRLTVVTTTSLGTVRTATLTARTDLVFEAGKVSEVPVRPDDYAVTGKVWYVSNVSGNDSRNGLSPSTALKNLYKVLEKVKPGDQVRLMPGTWNYSYDAFTLEPKHSGTAGNYISFVAHDPSNKPVIHAGGANVWNAIKSYASYVVFDGIVIEGDCASISQSDAYASAQYYYDNGSFQSGTARYNTNGISIEQKSGEASGPHHVIVRNCVVHDLPGGGIGVSKGDYITIENNVVYNCAWYSMYANSGISVIYSTDTDANTGYKIVVQGNVVSDCHTEVPWVRREVPSFNMSDGNGIIIDVNQSTSYSGRTLVQNNLSFYNGGSGIHTYKANHVDIVGNTTYYNGRMYNGNYGEIWGNQSDDVHISNNIMCGGRTAASSMCNLGDNDVVYTNNICWQGNVTYQGSGYLYADPLFVNASTDRTVADFHLRDGSPAIGHGASLSYNPSRDLDGKRRDGRFDCGAYQY